MNDTPLIYTLIGIILILTVILTVEDVRPEQWEKSVQICETHGGVKYLNSTVFAATLSGRCVNDGVKFIDIIK